MGECNVSNNFKEEEEEEEDMEAWLDDELEKIKSEDLEINDDNQNASVAEVSEPIMKKSDLKEEGSPEIEKEDTFSRFLQGFDELVGSDNVNETEQKDVTIRTQEPHLLYKDQLQAALAARNLTLDDFLRTQSLLNTEKESEAGYNKRSPTPELVNLQDMKLDEEEIKEIEDKWNSGKCWQTYISEKCIICRPTEPPKANIGAENPKASNSGPENQRKSEISKKEREREEHARKQLARLQCEMKERLRELNESIERERENLVLLRKLRDNAETAQPLEISDDMSDPPMLQSETFDLACDQSSCSFLELDPPENATEPAAASEILPLAKEAMNKRKAFRPWPKNRIRRTDKSAIKSGQTESSAPSDIQKPWCVPAGDCARGPQKQAEPFPKIELNIEEPTTACGETFVPRLECRMRSQVAWAESDGSLVVHLPPDGLSNQNNLQTVIEQTASHQKGPPLMTYEGDSPIVETHVHHFSDQSSERSTSAPSVWPEQLFETAACSLGPSLTSDDSNSSPSVPAYFKQLKRETTSSAESGLEEDVDTVDDVCAAFDVPSIDGEASSDRDLDERLSRTLEFPLRVNSSGPPELRDSEVKHFAATIEYEDEHNSDADVAIEEDSRTSRTYSISKSDSEEEDEDETEDPCSEEGLSPSDEPSAQQITQPATALPLSTPYDSGKEENDIDHNALFGDSIRDNRDIRATSPLSFPENDITNQRPVSPYESAVSGLPDRQGGGSKPCSTKSVDAVSEKATLINLHYLWLAEHKTVSCKSKDTRPNHEKRYIKTLHNQKRQLRDLPLEFLLDSTASHDGSQIVKMDVFHVALNATFSPLHSHCPNLSVLKLRQCSLSSAAASSICKLGCLKILDLSENEIEVFELDDVTRNSLLVLDLSNNAIERPEDIAGPLKNLAYLDLSSNKMTSFDVNKWCTVAPNAIYISLLDNLISFCSESAPHFSSEPPVCSFNFTGNQISSIGTNTLSNVAPVWLNFSENTLFELPSRGLHAPVLHELILDGNHLDSIEPLARSWLPNLCLLSVNENRLSGLPKLCLPKLSALYLRRNHLADLRAFTDAVRLLPAVQILDIRQNPLSTRPDAQYTILGALPSILLLQCTEKPSESSKPVEATMFNDHLRGCQASLMNAFSHPLSEAHEEDPFISNCYHFTKAFRRKMSHIRKYFAKLCPEKTLPQIRTQNLKPVGSVCVGLAAGEGEERTSAGESISTASSHAAAISHRRELCPQMTCQIQRFVRVIGEMRNLVWEHLELQTQGPASAVLAGSEQVLQSAEIPQRPPSMGVHTSKHQGINGAGVIDGASEFIQGRMKTIHRDIMPLSQLGGVPPCPKSRNLRCGPEQQAFIAGSQHRDTYFDLEDFSRRSQDYRMRPALFTNSACKGDSTRFGSETQTNGLRCSWSPDEPAICTTPPSHRSTLSCPIAADNRLTRLPELPRPHRDRRTDKVGTSSVRADASLQLPHQSARQKTTEDPTGNRRPRK
nr:unnamed protein product [Spirometra erinaceieuropaei]